MKKLLYIILCLPLFSVLTCSPDNPGEDILVDSYERYTAAWKTSTPEEQGIDAAMLQMAFDEAKKHSFMFSLLVVRNGFLVKEEYYNKRKPNTLDIIKSCTKSYVGALFGLAWSMGYIDSLDQKLLDIFPEYDSPDLDPRKKDITLRHLLTMQQGLDSDENLVDAMVEAPDMVEAIINSDLIFDPGTNFGYSSFSSHLLSAVITKTTGVSTQDFGILNLPINILSMVWEKDQNGINYGGSGLYLAPRDMARLGYLYLQNGRFNGVQILPEEWIELSTQNTRNFKSDWSDKLQDVGYGFQWWTGRFGTHSVYFAAGFGGQWILNIPDLQMIVVSTMNTRTDEAGDGSQSDFFIDIVGDYIIPAAE